MASLVGDMVQEAKEAKDGNARLREQIAIHGAYGTRLQCYACGFRLSLSVLFLSKLLWRLARGTSMLVLHDIHKSKIHPSVETDHKVMLATLSQTESAISAETTTVPAMWTPISTPVNASSNSICPNITSFIGGTGSERRTPEYCADE